MKLAGLLRRNLRFHRRGNFAVFLGVAVGTAVLTGALLVGDSLQGSLRDLTGRRLGWVDQAMVTGRFFREDLAGELSEPRYESMTRHQDKLVTRQSGLPFPVPALVFQGTATATSGNINRRGRARNYLGSARGLLG